MDKITNHVFVAQDYPGVVSSVILLEQGALMVDSPLRFDDRQSWQKTISDTEVGKKRLMVMLDTHVDRLHGTQMIDFPVLAHESALQMIQDLPNVPRVPNGQEKIETDAHDLPQNFRWAMPDLTYSKQVSIYWDEQPVEVAHRPGVHPAASWVKYSPEKVVFVGDSVIISQPPYLEWCDPNCWIDELTTLCSEAYSGYKIIGGRNGVVRQRSILKMIDFLTSVKEVIGDLSAMETRDEQLTLDVIKLLKKINFDHALVDQYKRRLTRGLKQLLIRYENERFQL